MVRYLIAAVVVILVIAGECWLAFCILPGRPTNRPAAARLQAAAEPAPSLGGEADVDLGRFSIVVGRGSAGDATRVNFHLVGSVGRNEHADFMEQYAKCQHRLREQVIYEVQRAGSPDLADPGLPLIKRELLATSNDLLGRPLLRRIEVRDYSLVGKEPEEDRAQPRSKTK